MPEQPPQKITQILEQYGNEVIGQNLTFRDLIRSFLFSQGNYSMQIIYLDWLASLTENANLTWRSDIQKLIQADSFKSRDGIELLQVFNQIFDSIPKHETAASGLIRQDMNQDAWSAIKTELEVLIKSPNKDDDNFEGMIEDLPRVQAAFERFCRQNSVNSQSDNHKLNDFRKNWKKYL